MLARFARDSPLEESGFEPLVPPATEMLIELRYAGAEQLPSNFGDPVGLQIIGPVLPLHSGTESLQTHRWRRQSRANSSLKPNCLLAGKIQAILLV
jgi:hypothetical protein